MIFKLKTNIIFFFSTLFNVPFCRFQNSQKQRFVSITLSYLFMVSEVEKNTEQEIYLESKKCWLHHCNEWMMHNLYCMQSSKVLSLHMIRRSKEKIYNYNAYLVLLCSKTASIDANPNVNWCEKLITPWFLLNFYIL